MPGCVWFHAVTSGHCELVVGGDRVELQSGDLALVPHGAGHRIEAGGPTEHPNIPDLPHEQQSENYAVLRHGGTVRSPSWSAADCASSTPAPAACWTASRPVVHIRTVRRTVLGATLDLLADEVQGREVGSEAVISRLCDVLVIQAIRHWMTTGEATGSRWLQAMGDPQVGPALAALHAAPGEPWTVGSLAARAAMSRSAFAARFRELLGQPVMGYLTELRMQLAVDLLHRHDRTVAEVATAVGYESDASFSRVFKRHLGTSPRRTRATPDDRLHPDQPQRRHGSQGARLGRGAPWPMPAPPPIRPRDRIVGRARGRRGGLPRLRLVPGRRPDGVRDRVPPAHPSCWSASSRATSRTCAACRSSGRRVGSCGAASRRRASNGRRCSPRTPSSTSSTRCAASGGSIASRGPARSSCAIPGSRPRSVPCGRVSSWRSGRRPPARCSVGPCRSE